MLLWYLYPGKEWPAPRQAILFFILIIIIFHGHFTVGLNKNGSQVFVRRNIIAEQIALLGAPAAEVFAQAGPGADPVYIPALQQLLEHGTDNGFVNTHGAYLLGGNDIGIGCGIEHFGQVVIAAAGAQHHYFYIRRQVFQRARPDGSCAPGE